MNKDRYSRAELHSLLASADSFLTARAARLQSLDWLYRDKTPQYYDDVIRKYGGIEAVYAKDTHGDPRSPINERINGLFFTAQPGQPRTQSIYGTRRLLLPVPSLLTTSHNVYFADFYCVNRKMSPHYITLVATLAGSATDAFCRKHLLELNLGTNSILRCNGQVAQVVSCDRLHIELLYTEDIPVVQMVMSGKAHLQDVRGVSVIASGVRQPRAKNAFCSSCNPQSSMLNRSVSIDEWIIPKHGEVAKPERLSFDDARRHRPMYNETFSPVRAEQRIPTETSRPPATFAQSANLKTHIPSRRIGSASGTDASYPVNQGFAGTFGTPFDIRARYGLKTTRWVPETHSYPFGLSMPYGYLMRSQLPGSSDPPWMRDYQTQRSMSNYCVSNKFIM